MHRSSVMEECARNMACDHNGEVVSQEDYRKPMTKMGEVGKSAIENIRSQKKNKHIKPKAEDTDKQHRVFESQDHAILFGKTLGAKLIKRSKTGAPKELQTDGKNPSSAELFNRMWGINDKTCVRMVPTTDEKWCVYWRPSLIKAQLEDSENNKSVLQKN